MFPMVDLRMSIIMQAHNDFVGGLNNIVTSNLYQVALVCDRLIFKPSSDGLNKLIPNFWILPLFQIT
jgi:hypothetical protein